MNQRITKLALVVADYDEAIAYYCQKLGFLLTEDTDMGAGKRWVTVQPSGNSGPLLVLAQAKKEAERRAIGNQTGGRVFLFLETDDFWRDYEKMLTQEIDFCETPRHEAYGTVVVFRDLYGNKWDFIGPPSPARGEASV
ncbi:MAG: VOC family protein [Verrucomicrobiota bacterium]